MTFLYGARATWEHRPTTFWPYHVGLPHGVSAYGVFLLWDAQFGYWLQKVWSQRLKCQTAFSGRKNQYISAVTARVLTMPMVTTLCLSVKAVG